MLFTIGSIRSNYSTQKLEKEYNKKQVTYKFLEECRNVGLKIVALHTQSPLVPTSMKWTKDKWYEVSVFGEGSYDGWPAIWKACDKAQIESGCGNSNQRQVPSGTFIPGIYQLKDSEWTKID
jgi:hypothetical protein